MIDSGASGNCFDDQLLRGFKHPTHPTLNAKLLGTPMMDVFHWPWQQLWFCNSKGRNLA